MSKGGRGAAANLLLLKKNEDKRQQETALVDKFKKVDLSNDGKWKIEEYQRFLIESGSTREEIINILEDADKNGDGYVDNSDEIVDKVKTKGGGEVERKADRAFSLMDRNNDGFITKQEMLNTTSKLTEKQVHAVFERNDKDGDGKLSKQEFKEMMMKEKKLNRKESDKEIGKVNKETVGKNGKLVRNQSEKNIIGKDRKRTGGASPD